MSVSSEDIYIAIKVDTKQLEEANKLLAEFTTKLNTIKTEASQGIKMDASASEMNKLNTAVNMVTDGFHGMSNGLTSVFDKMQKLADMSEQDKLAMLNNTKVLAKFPEKLNMTADAFEDLWKEFSKAPTQSNSALVSYLFDLQQADKMSGETAGKVLGLYNIIGRGLGTQTGDFKQLLAGEMGNGFESFKLGKKTDSITKSLSGMIQGSIIGDMGRLETQMARNSAIANRFGEDINQVTSEVRKFGNAHSRTEAIMIGVAHYTELGTDAQTQLKNTTNLSEEALTKYSAQMTKSNNDMQIMRAYSNEVKAAIGPLGTAFRETTMQLYWASLGMMFYTMTLGRADKARLTSETRANSLAKTYYNLTKLQKQLTEANLQYGSSSEQAAEASVQLAMAENDLKLQKEQLRISAKDEAMQQIQSYLTLIPLTVNSMYMMMQSYGSLRGLVAASTEANVLHAASTQQDSAATNQNTTSKLVNANVERQLAIANAGGFFAKMRAAAGTWSLKAATDSLAVSLGTVVTLENLATMGLGFLFALGSTFLMNAYAEDYATKQMEQLNAEAEKSYTSFNKAAGAADGYSYALTGNTVSKSAIIARKEVSKLNSELGNLNEAGNLEITASTPNVLKTTSLDNNLNQVKSVTLNVSFHDTRVTSEQDMDIIVNKVYNSLNKELSGAGVKY